MSKIVTTELQHPSATSPNITLNADGSVANVAGMGKVLQVAQAVKTDTFTTTSTSFVDVTGLAVSITPSSATSKILVIAQLYVGNAATNVYTIWRLIRDSTAVYVGDAAGSRTRSTGSFIGPTEAGTQQAQVGVFLDSPNVTSSTTYKIDLRVTSSTGTVGRSGSDTDGANFSRTPSSITAFEIAG
jgi:hypothetical protein